MSSWRHRTTASCCHSLAGRRAASAAGSPPPASPCHRGAPWSYCCSATEPMRMSFSRSIHSLGLTCRPRQWHTCGNRRHSGIYYGYWTSFPPSDLKKLPHAEESRGSLGPLTKNNLLCVCVGFVSFSHKHTPSQACVSVYLPGGCSQQHLPVVTPAVYEDITGRSVRAGATETLRSVALL